MKRIRGQRRLGKRLLVGLMVMTMIVPMARGVGAVTLTDIQKQKEEAEREKKETQKELDNVQSEIDAMEGDKENAEAEIEEIDEELVDILLSIDIINEDIANKKAEIEAAQVEYDESVIREEEQKKAMNRRIKFMYEKGDVSYMTLLLESQSLAEAVNKQDYTEKLYAYDRVLLEQYQETKAAVAEKQVKLETELSELEEIDQDLQEQKDSLQAMIDERQEILDNFDEQLSAARDKANSYKDQIRQQASEIKQIEQAEAAKKAEEEAKRKAEEAARKKAEEEAKKKAAEEAAANGEQPSESSDTPEPPSEPASPGDASKGQEIANFACQFVGNPYVAGGTSLTEGCDCSGFTSSVYAHFGISLPRSSYAQSAAGRPVTYAEAQPGDVMYYGGHVAIYIGNNQIVHASTAATGIKISNASYRTVITIRRFV